MQIDSTTKKMGDIKFGENVYIGPFCILGFPSTEIIDPQDFPKDQFSEPLSKGAIIGSKTSLLSHIVVGEGTIIGDNVWCDHHSYIGCDTYVGNNTYIMYGARIYNRVKIAERCWIAGFVCNDAVIETGAIVMGQLIHRFVNAEMGMPEVAPVVRKNAFIGMNAQVIGPVEVGEGAYIGAGAVLTQSALPGRLYLGTPARDSGPSPKPFKDSQE